MSSASLDRPAIPVVAATSSQPSEKIIQRFNTWAFKREQPSDLSLLRTFIDRSVAARRPIEFVLYWGKGPRDHFAQAEVDCLDYLQSMRARIADVYSPGAVMTLVFTDTHALHNGYSQLEIQRYFQSVDDLASRFGFASTFLSRLTAGIDRHALVTAAAFTPEMRDRLEKCAAKWFRGEGSITHGAAEYFAMNMVERRGIELNFPDAVFITFNGSEYRDIFPTSLPIFYMYSMRRGTSVKPWFFDIADKAIAE